ncbi:MAG: MFS transporter [Leptolyngbya sp. SIO4C1]|nr:MFS transporter [Leptolyngbya sp. SIO4C1]
MQKFTFLWLSRLISAIGTRMADFAITLWVWELTGSATALALTGFFYELPRIVASLFSGILIDRTSHKYLMILKEATAAVSMLVLLVLHLTGHLLIWHLYVAAFARSGFEKCGWITYQSSIALLVAPDNYIRANSMESAVGYGASIVAPAIAGMLYPHVGLSGILPIDLAALSVAIAILAILKIPQPEATPNKTLDGQGVALKLSLGQAGNISQETIVKTRHLWDEITFGIRYIWQTRGLRMLLVITASFWLAHDLGGTVYDPMILARTDSSSQALGAVGTAAGFGGVIGAIALSIWGGFRQNHQAMLIGYMGAGLAKITFGLGQSLSVWIPAQFCSSLNFPLLVGSETTLWMAATPASLHGRIFAARAVIDDILDLSVVLLAGVLADRVFEPAMTSPSLLQSLFAPIFGTAAGAGTALLYVGCAIAMVLVGILGFNVLQLRLIEKAGKAEL